MNLVSAIGVVVLATSAQAVVINFDDLPAGTVVTNQYAAQGAIFSSNQFNVVLPFTSGPTPTSFPNILCTSSTADLTGLNCAERTTIDFIVPVNNLTFLVVEANDPGIVGRVAVYQGGAIPSAFVNILGIAGGNGNYTMDLSAFAGITRIDLEGPTGPGSSLDPVSQSGIGWDDFSFTPVPSPGAAALLGLGGLIAVRRRR